MTGLTLYDLMGEDHEIEAQMMTQKEINLIITNEMGDIVYDQQSHIFAWDSLVSFARQVIACNERIQKELETLE